MPSAEEGPIELPPGTPLAAAVARGIAAFAQGDEAGGDAAYQEAVHLAAPTAPGLWPKLAVDHVVQLLRLRRATRALQRCDEYLNTAGQGHVSLRVLRAEIRSSVGDHRGAVHDLAAIHEAVRDQRHSLTPHENAVLNRLTGLAAAEQGRLDEAATYLHTAHDMLRESHDRSGVQHVERDIAMILVRGGDDTAMFAALGGQAPRTVPDYLLLTQAFRSRLRYEEAAWMLARLLGGSLDGDIDLDPALRFTVIHELVVLLRLTRDHDAAQRLLPALQQAVARSPDPAASAAALQRLSQPGAADGEVDAAFHSMLQHARRLVTDERFDEAERLVAGLRPRALRDHEVAGWHLAAGELDLARSTRLRIPLVERQALFGRAAEQFTAAAERASTTALVEIRVQALRLLGDADIRLGAAHGVQNRQAVTRRQGQLAADCWAESHRLEEHIAERQVSPDTRIRMLQAVPDEFDQRIRAAEETACERGHEARAAVVVAMEAARGTAIISSILPGAASAVRNLPGPSDYQDSWRWVQKMADSLPRGQVAWLLHATPDRVHHAVLGAGILHHDSVHSRRKDVTDAIDALMKRCWNKDFFEQSVADGTFDQCLDEIAWQIGLGAVIPALPAWVRRIAIVTGGELAEIPFAALTIPGSAERIGLRYALSDLPCLSARLPLAQRSRRVRGDKGLLVSPPFDGLGAARMPSHTPLDGARATQAQLRAILELRRHRQLRIDTHGGHDPTRSWLQLAPSGLEGQLTPDTLQRMDLSACGTVVLGACESGMARRIGRDERTGFVRAALHAGAASVVAARWIAPDVVAGPVLDRFEQYIRYLPRDVALQRAQLDLCRGELGSPADLPAPGHPARWACWTLYGDSGWQTGAGPLRRLLRRNSNERSRRAAHR